jgi:RES domain-containing protein
MEIYRICLAKWAEKLGASGNSARWNSKGRFMIYTASSRALACLKNVVHRSGAGLTQLFKVQVIEASDTVGVTEITSDALSADWAAYDSYPETQALGDRWLDSQASVLLRVPSAIIPNEFNYLLNPSHPDFQQIRLARVEDFVFDPRIKGE